MSISKNVIRDLLPVYAAGEASADTRALVDAVLATDEELRNEIYELEAVPHLPDPATPPDLGIVSLKRTQRLLRERTFLVGFCYLFTALTLAFVGRPGGLEWGIPMFKAAATGCLAIGSAGWVAFLRNAMRLRDTGLQPRQSLWPQLCWQAGALCFLAACGAVLYDWTHWAFLDRHSALVVPLSIALGTIGQRLKQYKPNCETVMPVETLFTLTKRRDPEDPE